MLPHAGTVFTVILLSTVGMLGVAWSGLVVHEASLTLPTHRF